MTSVQTQQQNVSDDGSLAKYFSMMLHIDDDDLDPFEYKLLGHYRKQCGLSPTRICTESTSTTATGSKMSAAKVRTVRDQLVVLGRIEVTETIGQTVHIKIKDCLAENLARYSNRNPSWKREGGTHENVRGGLTDSRVIKEYKEVEEDNTSLLSFAPDGLYPYNADLRVICMKPVASNSAMPAGWNTVLGLIVTGNPDYDGYKRVAKLPFKEEFKPKEKSSAKKEKVRKPWSDLTDALHNAMPVDLRAKSPHYAAHNDAAKTLHDEGFTPARIAAYIEATYPGYRKWAESDNKPLLMSMQHIERHIRGWESTHRKVELEAAKAKEDQERHDKELAELLGDDDAND